MADSITWSHFGWQGIQFDVPADWNLAQVTGEYESGYLRLDDDDMVRSAAGLMIERLGFRVLSASGGAEAVDLFRKNRREVSCVLLDVTMPVMDGEETFWVLREIRADVPVLFMSGHSSRDIDSRLLGKSRVGRLRKPFHRAELEQRLRGVLEEGRSKSSPGD